MSDLVRLITDLAREHEAVRIGLTVATLPGLKPAALLALIAIAVGAILFYVEMTGDDR